MISLLQELTTDSILTFVPKGRLYSSPVVPHEAYSDSDIGPSFPSSVIAVPAGPRFILAGELHEFRHCDHTLDSPVERV